MLRHELDTLVVAIAGDAFKKAAAAVAVGLTEGGDDGERGQARESFDVVGGLDGIVEIFAKKSQADTADESDDESESDVASLGRPRGSRRNHGRVDNANVRGLKSAGDVCFLQLGQHAVVESFVGFGFALEDVVFDEALGHLA